jgi:hypothetical protein
VPSIVYGLLGLGLFVKLVGMGFGTVLVASMTLSLLILPIVIISAQEAIRSVPDDLRQASYGMGATRWQVIKSVVLPESLAVIERADPRRGYHTGLSHPAAQQLPVPPRRLHERRPPGEERTDWGAESLGETAHHGVDGVDEGRRGNVVHSGRVEQSCTVEVHRNIHVVSSVGGRSDGLRRECGPALAVVSVLQREEPGTGPVPAGLDVSRSDLLGRDLPALVAVDGPRLDGRVLSQTRQLPLVDVALALTQQFLSALGVRPGRHLVPHRP